MPDVGLVNEKFFGFSKNISPQQTSVLLKADVHSVLKRRSDYYLKGDCYGKAKNGAHIAALFLRRGINTHDAFSVMHPRK